MRIILRSSARLTIDLAGIGITAAAISNLLVSRDRASWYRAVTRLYEEQPGRNVGGTATVEESLFVGLVELLQRHHARFGGAPTRKLITAVVEASQDLLQRGQLADEGPHDSVFLAKLLAVIETLSERDSRPFLTDLSVSVRRLLVDDDFGNGENGGSSGNGVPGSSEGAPNSGKSDKSNGTPSNGSQE